MPPAGYKRSRALWDETRRPSASTKDWIRAIAYELQPIRFSRSNQRQFVSFANNVWLTFLLVIKSIPSVAKATFRFLLSLRWKQWLALGGVILYYYFVRLMHEFLEAGPVIIIVTCLSLIFTIGLGDDGNRDGLSAYAVFNRGFERLMGSVDAEALMAQHLGGGLAGGMGVGALPPEEEEDEGAGGGRRRRQQNRAREAGNNIDDNEDNGGGRDNNQNRARKSGKKARRRNLEQRREIQNQREAAAGLDMQFGNGEAMADQVAVQRLIEEQIAADNQRDD